MDLGQYYIVLVNLDPTVGREIRKTRPCVIISPDEMNRHLRTIMVAPMTTASKPYPTRVKTRLKEKTGWIAIDQIRTVDRKRVLKILGNLTIAEIVSVKQVIQETLVE